MKMLAYRVALWMVSGMLAASVLALIIALTMGDRLVSLERFIKRPVTGIRICAGDGIFRMESTNCRI